MSVITIVLKDEDDAVNVEIKSDTPLPSDENEMSPAQVTALILQAQIQAIMEKSLGLKEDEDETQLSQG